MVSEGKITVEEAEKLLAALASSEPTKSPSPSSTGTEQKKIIPNYLCVTVEPKEGGESGDRVNVRIPLKIIKAGLKLSAFMPDAVKEKTQAAMNEKGLNFDLNDLNKENIDEFLASMADFRVDVDSANERVLVYCCE